MLDPQELANRYAALWSETDPEARRPRSDRLSIHHCLRQVSKNRAAARCAMPYIALER
jgi:hypothetical protein